MLSNYARKTELLLLLFLSQVSGSVFARDNVGYNYLMYSDPIVLQVSDSNSINLRITAKATNARDTLLLVVDDQVVDTAYVSQSRRSAKMRYVTEDVSISVRCDAKLAKDDTVDHECRVLSKRQKVGTLLVNKRIYPKERSKATRTK